MQQPSLFDRPEAPRARARSSDFSTSHAAAVDLNRSGTAAAQAAKVLEALKANPDVTSHELAEVMRADRHMVARRLPDLRCAHKVKNGLPRVCRITGRHAIVWRAETW